ncbi:alpha/beta fold hydrolase [Rhodococcus sp. OK302]|uniref:alpha/beta fold hydrolase n=1 Tax=Rhodococcus sp. OK302 TaxID=1882769 RepID=UPI000B93CE7A|nr:alpha/beta fold hydrolase [Rhodococcus sp. OK302]OYD71301.1 pimeloyl-ACP methyl ester carboxylesterase [Rhodococcus sp. OK302]
MTAEVSRLTTYTRSGLTFDVRDEGPIDGPVVVLLHGFPQDSSSWDRLVPYLHARGYRTVAPDQRGYSPGARPKSRWSYRGSELAADTVALIDAVGVGKVHLVGHDWGAGVAWEVAALRPDLLRTLTALSVPHPLAFVRAMVTSTQGLKSWYMAAFQLPILPEWIISKTVVGQKVLVASGQASELARRDLDALRSPGRLRGGLNWYRAMWMRNPKPRAVRISVPTLHIWSDNDTAIGPKGSELTPRFVDGPYRFEVLRGVSHWIPDEVPQQLDRLLAEHLSG